MLRKKRNNNSEQLVISGYLPDISDRLQDFLELRQLYNAAMRKVRTKLEILDEEFQVRYNHNPIHHIECRLKSPQSIIEKLNRKGYELSLESIKKNIMDIAGIRVICNYIDDIYII